MAWVNGGYTKSIESADFPGGYNPPISMAYVHRATCESASVPNWVTIPLFGRAGVPLAVTVYVHSPFGLPDDFIVPPTTELLDPGKEYSDPAAVLDSDSMSGKGPDENGWYALTVTHTPAYDGQFILRVKGQSADLVWDWYPVYEGAEVGGGIIRRIPKLVGA